MFNAQEIVYNIARKKYLMKLNETSLIEREIKIKTAKKSLQ